jgi:hydroxypyruvate reductase/glycerate 2-kinase
MKVEILKDIIYSSIEAVKPDRIITNAVKLSDKILCINEHFIDLTKHNKLFIAGSGKASLKMALSMKELLSHNNITPETFIVSNYGEDISGIQVFVGSHPLPTNKSVEAAKSMIDFLSKCKKDDFLIYLLSGGSSALMELPKPPLTIDDIQNITNTLLKAGLNIDELNFVRKKLSLIKGGKLNRYINCNGCVLVLSDVIGDKLESIGSAPLYYKSESFNIKNLIDKYNLEKKISKTILDILLTEEEVLPNKLPHFIIGNNHTALRAAKHKAQEFGLKSEILTSTLRGEASQAGKFIVSIGEYQSKHINENKLFIFGGETTVTVRGTGLGGRNQELALSALQEIEENKCIYIASIGTDGIDGPTDAAGAIVNADLFLQAKNKSLIIDNYLNNNDSYNFFKKVGGHIKLGPTGTNVCDIVFLLIFPDEVNRVG